MLLPVVPLALATLFAGRAALNGLNLQDRSADDRLTFQTHRPWMPRININAGTAMAYGIEPSLPDRMKTWQEHGYRVEVMTGVAWGQYQDYLNGQFDGKQHWDIAQTERSGKKILHGGNADIPYISPDENYGRYLSVGIKRALDAGAKAIYLEEPEFWARGGYSEGFKREWQAYYHEPWQDPETSVDSQYRASKLKYFLYRRALSQVFDFVKEYGRSHGRTIPCYVPTHSVLNYAHWRIVSPESSLIDVGADGYIAQVWTGTARTPNVYEGRQEERTFETAFLEYGSMQNLVRASGRRVWYLNDPIEDNPNHDWNDYRRNWESTLIASLLQPEVWNFEVMPWPERIFNGKYPASKVITEKPKRDDVPVGTGLNGFGRADVPRVGIPQNYETELQAVITTLGAMKQPPESVHWRNSGTGSIGVLVSDTMMFQRSGSFASDANLGSFYGLTLPLLSRGLPIEPVQIERVTAADVLKPYRLLFLTYEGQKPPSPQLHKILADWTKAGNALVVVDDDHDPFLAVREWWSNAPQHYKTPREHLFEELGLKGAAAGSHRVGKGIVVFSADSPAALSYRPEGGESIRQLANEAARAINLPWKESSALVLQRGPYIVAAGLSESNLPSPVLTGHFIELFKPGLSETTSVTVSPGKRSLLVDLDALPNDRPRIAAAACRVRNEKWTGHTLTFEADGIANTPAIVRVKSARPPTHIRVGNTELPAQRATVTDQTFSFSFANTPDLSVITLAFPEDLH